MSSKELEALDRNGSAKSKVKDIQLVTDNKTEAVTNKIAEAVRLKVENHIREKVLEQVDDLNTDQMYSTILESMEDEIVNRIVQKITVPELKALGGI